MTDRGRNTLILLIVAGLVAASVAVITAKKTRLGLDLKGGVQLVYQGKPTAQSKVDTESLNRAIDIMRKRVDQIGVAQPEIQRSGEDEITVSLPNVSNTTRAQEQVGKTAQLFFYDWEPNVIGPEGKPAPTETTATGGPNAGAAQFGLLQYQAIQRAAKRAPILRSNDTTWTPGCTPAQSGGCIYGSWYLIDTKHEKVLCKSGGKTCAPAETEQNLYAEGYKPPADAHAVAVRVNPGTIVVQARPEENSKGKVTQLSPNSFFVLNDDPVLAGKDITHPQQSFDEGAGGTGAPNVTFGFTSHGQSVFQNVTKKIAQRGQEAQLPGVGKEAAQQHFAVVLDGQLITTPSIDYTKYPEGIDATNGSQISGGFTITSAQNLADELQSGALPIKLVADLALAGLGDARQTGAQRGPDRRSRGLRGRVPVPAGLLPRARRDRRRRPDHLRDLLLRADQADPDHADAAGDRRPDPHDRRRGRREHRDLRARQGGDPRRAARSSRASRPATNAASRRSSTRTSSRS